ncbi:(d)CMP kinase [Eionea flava]
MSDIKGVHPDKDAAPVITIDGPSGSGKGTICQRLAQQLGFHLLDSGALYRLTAVACVAQSVDLQDIDAAANVARHLNISFKPTDQGVVAILDGSDVTADIRKEAAGMGASVVAAHIPVREALLARQRSFQQSPGLVADGRDMGTTVFPQASVKVFLTASAEERAQRRYKQLLGRGESANLRVLLDDIEARDKRDTERSASPLQPADDAITIDSTTMSINEVLDAIMVRVKQRIE